MGLVAYNAGVMPPLDLRKVFWGAFGGNGNPGPPPPPPWFQIWFWFCLLVREIGDV